MIRQIAAREAARPSCQGSFKNPSERDLKKPASRLSALRPTPARNPAGSPLINLKLRQIWPRGRPEIVKQSQRGRRKLLPRLLHIFLRAEMHHLEAVRHSGSARGRRAIGIAIDQDTAHARKMTHTVIGIRIELLQASNCEV